MSVDPSWLCGSTNPATTKTTTDDLQNPCSEIKESIAGYARGTSRVGTTTKPTPTTTPAKPQALYRFFDDSGRLLYVGISADPGRRWKQHRKDKPWWADVASITVEHYPDRPSVEAAEMVAIETERPIKNVVHNKARRTRWRVYEPMRVVGADEMPDDCHDICVRYGGFASIYYPYKWRRGHALYECAGGHHWTCGWGHDESGDAPENRGRPIQQVAL